MSIEKTLKELEALSDGVDVKTGVALLDKFNNHQNGNNSMGLGAWMDDHRDALIDTLDAFPALKEEIERLRGALEFCADKKNYKVRKKSGFARNKASGHYTKTISPKVMFDKGHIARRTLKGDRDNG